MLSEYLPADKKKRREAVEQFTADMRAEMQQMLDGSRSLSEPLFSTDEVQQVVAALKK